MSDSRQLTKEQKLGQFNNLVLLAYMDGKLDEREVHTTLRIGERMGLNEAEMKRVIETAEDIEFVIPEDRVERVKMLYQLVLIMMVDGKIDDKEYAFCVFIADKLGFIEKIVRVLIDHIGEMAVDDLSIEDILVIIDGAV